MNKTLDTCVHLSPRSRALHGLHTIILKSSVTISYQVNSCCHDSLISTDPLFVWLFSANKALLLPTESVSVVNYTQNFVAKHTNLAAHKHDHNMNFVEKTVIFICCFHFLRHSSKQFDYLLFFWPYFFSFSITCLLLVTAEQCEWK